ncbi:hypothetical protein [Actinophytocola sp.]|uniref:hypothetical protein n=1 Tax=Actinophytocola sp. TaxID=1872138 RepID=UPI002ED3BBC5
MRERLRRYIDMAVDEDPDAILGRVEKLTRAMRPVRTKRRHARNLVALAREQDRANRPRDALVVLDEAVTLARRVDREGDVLARALAIQAVCRLRIDDNEGAIDVATEAIRLLEPLAARKPRPYAFYLRQARWALAMAHYDLDQLAEAVPALERYIPMVRAMPELRPWEEINMLAAALFDLDRAADALPHVVEVVRLLRPLTVTDPATHEAQLAEALAFEVNCRLHTGQWHEACDIAAESVAILRRLVDAGQDQYQEPLAKVSFNFAQVSGGEPEHFSEAIGIIRGLSDAQTPYLAGALYVSMRPLIDAGRDEEALTAGTEAAALYRRLAETDPDYYASLLALVLFELGRVGEPAERLANLEEAVRLWRVAASPEQSNFADILAAMLVDIASCLDEIGQDGRAAAQEAVELYREIVRNPPEDVYSDWYPERLAKAEALLRRLSG